MNAYVPTTIFSTYTSTIHRTHSLVLVVQYNVCSFVLSLHKYKTLEQLELSNINIVRISIQLFTFNMQYIHGVHILHGSGYTLHATATATATPSSTAITYAKHSPRIQRLIICTGLVCECVWGAWAPLLRYVYICCEISPLYLNACKHHSICCLPIFGAVLLFPFFEAIAAILATPKNRKFRLSCTT